MAKQQWDVNKVRMSAFYDISDIAKLKTLIKGQFVPARSFSNRKARKEVRAKTVTDQLSEMVHELVKDVQADAESLAWEMHQRQLQMRNRKLADEAVRDGVNRKPRSEWLKPGRKPGSPWRKAKPADSDAEVAADTVVAGKVKAKRSVKRVGRKSGKQRH